jgi:3-hydroxyisobutyrate dehydrogenase
MAIAESGPAENPMVGIVGVGRMGRAMWSRLTEQGFDTIVFDVASSARDGAAQAGARVAASLEEVGANARTVVLSLPRSDDVEAAVFGDGGLATGLDASPGAGGAGAGPATVLDTTSGRPAVSRRVGAALAARGVDYLDVGVSGGVAGAAAGTLKLMIGGDEAVVARCDDLLAALGPSRWHCGDVGAGHAMKTVLNLAAQTKLMAEVEALLLGTAAGLDPDQVADVLGLAVWQTFLLGDGGRRPFGFTIELVCKDFDVAAQLAAEQGVAMPVNANALQLMRAAYRELGPDADLMDYVGIAERNAGTRIDEHRST